jgi:hypothetical protein
MWEQCVEVPGSCGVCAELPVGVDFGADPAPVEGVIVGGELPVAALAMAAPPNTRAPASPTATSVCRSRIFIAITSFVRTLCGRNITSFETRDRHSLPQAIHLHFPHHLGVSAVPTFGVDSHSGLGS